MLESRIRSVGFSLLVLVLLGFQDGCSHLRPTTSANDKSRTSPATLSAAGTGLAPATRRTPQQDAEILLALARSCELNGDFDQAVRSYQKALERDDSIAWAYHRLGLLHDKNGNGQAARDYYQQALDRAPDSPEVHCDLGYSCYLQGRWQEAELHLRRAVELRPGFDRANNNLALLLARSGRSDEALQQLAHAGTSEYDARVNVAFALMLDSQTGKAREQLELASHLQPVSGRETAAQLQRIATRAGDVTASRLASSTSTATVRRLPPVIHRP